MNLSPLQKNSTLPAGHGPVVPGPGEDVPGVPGPAGRPACCPAPAGGCGVAGVSGPVLPGVVGGCPPRIGPVLPGVLGGCPPGIGPGPAGA